MMKKLSALAILALWPGMSASAQPKSVTAADSSGYIDAGQGVRLFYEKVGTGPNVVLVPLRTYLARDMRPLAAPDRTLIFYDVRNRGASSKVTRDDLISIEADVADVDVVRRWAGADKVSLIGYSYAGMMVAMYALQHPDHVERLVQLGPVPIKFGSDLPSDLVWSDPTPVIPPSLAEQVLKLREDGFHRTNPKEYCLRYNSLMRMRLVGDPRNADRIDVNEVCRHENEWDINLSRQMDLHFRGSVQKLDLPRDKIRALQTPVLTFHGTKDRNAPFAAGVEWNLTLPNARLIPVPGAAHQLWVEDRAAVTDISAFLAGNWPERAIQLKSWDEARRLLPKH